MQEAVASGLKAWESYYVIVGSSAAALTGLQFVVVAVLADLRPRDGLAALDAFGTPTVVHFCVALLVAADLSAPWPGLRAAAATLGLIGAGGLAYAAVVIRRARTQSSYTPVFEDWLWHTILPVVAYAAIVAGGIALVAHPTVSLFAVAAAVLLLVFVGIHNSWDTVTYVVANFGTPRSEGGAAAPTPGATPAVRAPQPSPAPRQGGRGRKGARR